MAGTMTARRRIFPEACDVLRFQLRFLADSATSGCVRDARRRRFAAAELAVVDLPLA
jgi:hypothetical protein